MRALVVPAGNPRAVAVDEHYPEPQPGPDEVRVRVTLAGVCATDLEIVRGYMRFAGVPGHEFVGVVADGPPALRGRRVVADINCPCGTCALCRAGHGHHCPHRTVLGIAGRDGAFAETLTIPAANCHVVPDEVSDSEAVFAEPLAAAAHVLDDVSLSRQTRVAVLGTGRLGLLVAQVLRAASATGQPGPGTLHVIGRNPRTLALCRAWGLETVSLENLRPQADYDVVVECTGAPDGLRLALQLARPRGTIVLKSTYAEPEPVDLAPVVIRELHVIGSRCGTLRRALELLRRRAVDVAPLITATYALRDGVAALAAAADPAHVKVLIRP